MLSTKASVCFRCSSIIGHAQEISFSTCKSFPGNLEIVLDALKLFTHDFPQYPYVEQPPFPSAPTHFIFTLISPLDDNDWFIPEKPHTQI